MHNSKTDEQQNVQRTKDKQRSTKSDLSVLENVFPTIVYVNDTYLIILNGVTSANSLNYFWYVCVFDNTYE
jgi:hypothetical protein